MNVHKYIFILVFFRTWYVNNLDELFMENASKNQ